MKRQEQIADIGSSEPTCSPWACCASGSNFQTLLLSLVPSWPIAMEAL
jgi:hypothetical protein